MIVQGKNFSKNAVFKYRIHNKIYRYPLHIHQFAELVVILSGTLNVTVDGRSEILHPGECALVFPFQTHKFSSSEPVHMGTYLFSPNMVADFFRMHEGEVGSSARFVPSAATKTLYELCIKDEEKPSIYIAKAFLYAVLNDFSSSVDMVKRLSNSNVASKVGEYVNEHYEDDIDLGYVAQQLGYSKNYLSHCIKSVFGMNFCQMLASLRVDKARRLLSESDMSVTQISYACGFGTERSFNRNFHSITGRTPTEYRKHFFCGKINDAETIEYSL